MSKREKVNVQIVSQSESGRKLNEEELVQVLLQATQHLRCCPYHEAHAFCNALSVRTMQDVEGAGSIDLNAPHLEQTFSDLLDWLALRTQNPAEGAIVLILSIRALIDMCHEHTVENPELDSNDAGCREDVFTQPLTEAEREAQREQA